MFPMLTRSLTVNTFECCQVSPTVWHSESSIIIFKINPLGANPTKWSNTLKQFVGKLPMNCLNVFDHFVGLTLKGLTNNLIPFSRLSSFTSNLTLRFTNKPISFWESLKMTNKIFTLCPVPLPLHSVSAISFLSTHRIIVFIRHTWLANFNF